MTKFTIEDLRDIAYRGSYDDRERGLALQLLSCMEQEPVCITDKSEIECLNRGEMANVMPPDFKGVDAGDEVLLYAAPQLPQPVVLSVPDEIPKLKDGRGFKYVKDGVHYSLNYANGWNQCRTAMLQGAEPTKEYAKP